MTGPVRSISDESRSDLDALLNALLPFAEDQLRKRGSFAPFAASVDTEGKVALAMAYNDTEGNTTSDLITMIAEGFRKDAHQNKIRATGICYDGRLRSASGGQARDAVLIRLEHKCGDSVEIARPYTRKLLKGIVFGDIVALQEKPNIFSPQSDDVA